MLHLVHHPLYASPGPVGGQFPWDTFRLMLTTLEESGCEVTLHSPEPMPRDWIEAVHDSDYVAEVFELRVPREKAP